MKQAEVPEEIPDAEHELVIERVAAIDVAKASGKVCVRLPGRAGRRVSRVWDVEATTGAVSELAEHLVEQGSRRSPSNQRRTTGGSGTTCSKRRGCRCSWSTPATSRTSRPAKTDKLDAVWLAKLTEKGLLRPSFVPPAPIRQLRDYTRLRVNLTRERSRYWQRLEKLLEDALIKLSAVASDAGRMSARDMVEALIAGERDPRRSPSWRGAG